MVTAHEEIMKLITKRGDGQHVLAGTQPSVVSIWIVVSATSG